jgi:hypothetical protein
MKKKKEIVFDEDEQTYREWAEEVPAIGWWMRVKIFLHIDMLNFRCSQCHKLMLHNDYFCSDKCRKDWVPF